MSDFNNPEQYDIRSVRIVMGGDGSWSAIQTPDANMELVFSRETFKLVAVRLKSEVTETEKPKLTIVKGGEGGVGMENGKLGEIAIDGVVYAPEHPEYEAIKIRLFDKGVK